MRKKKTFLFCWVTNLTIDCLKKEKTQRNIYCVSNSNGAVKIQWAHHSLFLVLFCSNKLHLVQYFHSKSLYWILGPNFWLAAGPSINNNLDVTEIARNVANLNDLDGKFSTARPTLDEQIFPSPSFAEWSIYVCLIEGKHGSKDVEAHYPNTSTYPAFQASI